MLSGCQFCFFVFLQHCVKDVTSDWLQKKKKLFPSHWLPSTQCTLQSLTFALSRDRKRWEEEVCLMLNLCLNHIKTAPYNFLNDLTRAATVETDHTLTPNIEERLPNGRESKHFISPHAVLALYRWANIIIAFNNSLCQMILFIRHSQSLSLCYH